MAMKVILQQKKTKKVRFGILGFSFTTLFFGLWVPLLRGDWKTFLFFIILYLGILSSIFMNAPYSMVQQVSDQTVFQSFNMSIVSDNSLAFSLLSILHFIIHIFGAVFYNRIYTQNLINSKYRPATEDSRLILKNYNISFPNQE